MDNKPKKPRFYTFMVVPHDAEGRTISLKIPAGWLRAISFLALFSLLLVGSTVVYSTILSRKLVSYADTMSRNRQQQVVINSFSDQTSRVGQAIEELVQQDNELRSLLGLKGWESKIKLSSDRVSSEAKLNKVSREIELANERLAERRQSFEELKSWVSLVRSRFAATPSTWPIYGRITSGFGYRVYPWHGVHTGVDIANHYGAPVRATANGIVSFAGWRTGYGKVVEIDHGNGISTLYGHNSAFAVRAGQQVGKGQIVSYVGMTGWTTGPHLHYEVRRWSRPVNPMAYLDLNIISASRIWTVNHL
jgi:murein DD-endopeptidase MepM/ murein hydrolase activator NlpD